MHVGQFGEGEYAAAPGLDGLFGNQRLGNVVEHEPLLGETAGEGGSRAEVERKDEDVVGEAEIREPGDAAAEVGPEQEFVVGLRLGDVANADQPGIGGQLLKLRRRLPRAQVDPADHAADKGVFVGQFEQPAGLGQAVLRLDGDTAIEAGAIQQRLQIGGEKIALKRSHGIGDPGVVRCAVAPEMLMRVDAHFFSGFRCQVSGDSNKFQIGGRSFCALPGARNYISRMLSRRFCSVAAAAMWLAGTSVPAQSTLPPITLDEYFNTTSIDSSALSPDGETAVIATESPDWKNSAFRDDLWLASAKGGLHPLTHGGSESSPQWSPDGRWIAFLSDRPLPGEAAGPEGAAGDDAKASRIWIIPADGGEALPLFAEKLDVRSFAWSPDGTAIYYSVTEPLTQARQDAQKQEWKDVIRWREQNRGDLLLKQAVEPALKAAVAVPAPQHGSDEHAAKEKSELPAGAEVIARSVFSIGEIAPSPDGKTIAFATRPVHHREENPDDYEIYIVGAGGGEVRRLTNNQALESGLRWMPDGRELCFIVTAASGSLEGPYRDVQGRLYTMDAASGKVVRLGASFDGSWEQFALLPDGRELALGLKGTEEQLYLVEGAQATKLPGRAGSYAGLATALHSNAILVRHSTINDATQLYLAADPTHPDQLTALSSFNPIFAQRARPEWKDYTWTADDGVKVEGVLIYPPGKKGAKHLRMLTFIHGGPADADGNRFGADWYDWATLAASNGWLVFRPNYRGSSGYGDEFMLQIAPHLVSKPGRDILEGVDALVKDGTADGDHLAIGGYSYGGYMTNWLITQTTRFRSAVTGAGAVEHAANWGNDDETWDDAWYLGGKPWDDPELYQSEAALFQFSKVKTPTHLVQGGADIRVSYLEGVTMERALDQLGVAHTFLVFPGEGHGLGKNPWHGYIKVREELKWLAKYDGE